METGCAEVSGRLADSIQINYQCLGKRSHIKLVGIQLCFPPSPPPMLGLLPREQSKTSAAFPSLHKPTVTLTRLKNDASDAGRLKYSGASLPSITPLWGEQSPSPKQGEQDVLWSGTAATNPCTQDNPIATLLPSSVEGRGALTRFQHVPAWVRCSLRRRLLGHK